MNTVKKNNAKSNPAKLDQEQQRIKIQHENERIVCEIAGVKSIGMISKSALINYICQILRKLDFLRNELYIAKPDHIMFENIQESEAAPLRLERIRRISEPIGRI